MSDRKNILFIMCDQLRYDYLSCAGHKTLQTPNIDALAARGVRFSNTYVQSPICGPSRMSFYTGRYVSSHGATGNFVPLRVGEHNIGDHLKPLGMRPVLVGKTHMIADQEGMKRLGIDPTSEIGVHHAQAGFEPYERDDGIHPDLVLKPGVKYNEYLKERGYDGHKNPWHWAANATEGAEAPRSGFFNDVANQPARVTDEESETPYMTRRAMQFLAEDDGETPWLLHLSYIKPHWPYIAPAPYHDMYGPSDVQPVHRSEVECEDPNPLAKLYQERISARTFSNDERREATIPAYMGLIKQIDDQLGILFKFMEERGQLDNTMIVFTSDHGDYFGDHWMGDKDFFHNPAVKVPLIIADPDPAFDATRGTVNDRFVEAIDIVPTFIERAGGTVPEHIIDGRSLMPLLRGEDVAWRDYVISEYDYFMQPFSPKTGRVPLECRTYMIANSEWKYIHAPGYSPMLFDLTNDPDEFVDLGRDPKFEDARKTMHYALADWSLQYRQRETVSEERAGQMVGLEDKFGVLIGYWDENDIEPPAQMPDYASGLENG
ncbi:alkaline phosphatase family protein [Algirhabdus cladophorae]|uniref:alkaline phosphatase family protein n=1 Tax=Algirhabdus cladophorae TaxID=3377108 RepID=UPI003B84AF90